MDMVVTAASIMVVAFPIMVDIATVEEVEEEAALILDERSENCTCP